MTYVSGIFLNRSDDFNMPIIHIEYRTIWNFYGPTLNVETNNFSISITILIIELKMVFEIGKPKIAYLILVCFFSFITYF